MLINHLFLGRFQYKVIGLDVHAKGSSHADMMYRLAFKVHQAYNDLIK